MSSLTSYVERGVAALTVEECRRLRTLLEDDEDAVVRATGLSRTPIYRAAAGLEIHSATRLALRMVLADTR
jgi:hypothetical protein